MISKTVLLSKHSILLQTYQKVSQSSKITISIKIYAVKLNAATNILLQFFIKNLVFKYISFQVSYYIVQIKMESPFRQNWFVDRRQNIQNMMNQDIFEELFLDDINIFKCPTLSGNQQQHMNEANQIFNSLIYSCLYREEERYAELQRKSIQQMKEYKFDKKLRGIKISRLSKIYKNNSGLQNKQNIYSGLLNIQNRFNHVNMINHIIQAKIMLQIYIFKYYFRKKNQQIQFKQQLNNSDKRKICTQIINVMLLIIQMERIFLVKNTFINRQNPFTPNNLNKKQKDIYQDKLWKILYFDELNFSQILDIIKKECPTVFDHYQNKQEIEYDCKEVCIKISFSCLNDGGRQGEVVKQIKIVDQLSIYNVTNRNYLIYRMQNNQTAVSLLNRISPIFDMINCYYQVKINHNSSTQVEMMRLKVKIFKMAFDSLQQLIIYLVDQYIRIVTLWRIKFTTGYPPIFNNRITIRKNNQRFVLQFDPYQGILTCAILGNTSQKVRPTYPKYPLIVLANQLGRQMRSQGLLIADSAEEYAFNYLIQEMRCISIKHNGNMDKAWKQIKNSPLFWNNQQKMSVIVNFQMKLSSYKIKEQKRYYWILQNILEQTDQYTFSQISRYYCINQGIIERAAYQLNIGNFLKPNNCTQASRRNYSWFCKNYYNHQQKYKSIIKMLSYNIESYNNKNSTYFVPNFQKHINTLRNMLAHQYFQQNKFNQIQYQIDEQKKISLIQEHFPKMLVFVHHWKPYLFQNLNKSNSQTINLLNKLFPNDESGNMQKKMKLLNSQIKQNYCNEKYNNQSHQANAYFFNKREWNQHYFIYWLFIDSRNLKIKNGNMCQLCKSIEQIITSLQEFNFWEMLRQFVYKNLLQESHDFSNHKICFGRMFYQNKYKNIFEKVITKYQKELNKRYNLQQEQDEQQEVQLLQFLLKKICQNMSKYNIIPNTLIFQLQYICPTLIADIQKIQYIWNQELTS